MQIFSAIPEPNGMNETPCTIFVDCFAQFDKKMANGTVFSFTHSKTD